MSVCMQDTIFEELFVYTRTCNFIGNDVCVTVRMVKASATLKAIGIFIKLPSHPTALFEEYSKCCNYFIDCCGQFPVRNCKLWPDLS